MTMKERLEMHKQIEEENREALERFRQGKEDPPEAEED